MFSQLRSVWMLTAAILQRLATVVFLLAALALSVATIGAATGHLPWLEFEVAIGGTAYPNAGELAQIALAALALPRCVCLPANARIMALDTSHRRFNMGMQDVARAYALAHSADRAGLFRLSSEFDAVRERLIYLRNHPNPSGLEQDLLEVAAQMSHVSQGLPIPVRTKRWRAPAPSCASASRRSRPSTPVLPAKAVSQELRHWAHEAELEEGVAASQLTRLRDELRAVLPELGIEEMQRADGTVIDLGKKAAE